MDTPASPNSRPLARLGVPRIIEAISAIRVSVIAALSGAVITVFTILGVLQRTVYPRWDLANLDSELSVATYFSATLLWAAAAGWLLVALSARPRNRSLWIWWPVLAWLAIDEGAAIHERVEKWSGIDWQVLYLPIIIIAALAWWGVVRRYRKAGSIDVLLIVGAVCWAGALLLELIQHWGGEPAAAAIYNPAMITEEAFEMAGSTVFLIAAVLALRPTASRNGTSTAGTT